MSAAKTLAKLDSLKVALAEKGAAAADALRQQALALAEAVGVFRLAGDARGNVLRIR